MNISSIIDHVDSAAKYKPREKTIKGDPQDASSIQQLTQVEITDTVNRLNRSAYEMKERVSFDFNDKTNTIIVKFIDKENNEVVREFPAKDIMKVAEHIHDYLGMLVDESR